MGFPKIGASAKGGKDFDPAPAGVHYAICTQVIHLGKQKSQWQGKEKVLDKVYLKFEIPDHRIEYTKNGQQVTGPITIGQTFTLSIGEKSNLGPFLTGWRGKPFTAEEQEEFNISSVIGKPCQLNIVHEVGKSDGKLRATISGAFPLIQEQKDRIKADPKRMQPEGELIVYSPDSPDAATYEKLPQWIKDKLYERVIDEPAQALASGAAAGADFDDEIPTF